MPTVAEMKRCIDCKQWDETATSKRRADRSAGARWGVCERVADHNDGIDVVLEDAEFDDDFRVEPYGSFGCVLWEARS